LASALDAPGRCLLTDRYYHRLDVRWRRLKYVPRLDKMLDKYRRQNQRDEKPKLTDLTGAPPEWHGVIQKTPPGTVVHAGRFYKSGRILVEAAIVWPDRRDRDLENAVLASIRPEDASRPQRLWQAMGLSVTVSRDFELLKSASKVGRVHWEFAPPGRRGPELVVERIALPEYWLDDPLRDWLQEELPPKWTEIRQNPLTVSGHRGEMLISRAKISPIASLRGLGRLRVDVAWQCPVEARVYRVSYIETSRQQDLSLPEHVEVHCCRPVPAAAGSERR